MLAGKTLEKNADLQRILDTDPPYAVKLSRHGLSDNMEDYAGTNLYAAIVSSEKNFGVKHRLHPMQILANADLTFDKHVLLVSDCGHKENIQEFIDASSKYGYQLIIYDKCNFCAHIPDGVYARPLRNVGRDAETLLRFITQYYYKLPDVLLFVPGNIRKWNRGGRMYQLLDSADDVTGCDNEHAIDWQKHFSIDEYEGVPLTTATVRPLQSWFEMYVGPWNTEYKGVCWNCVIKIQKEKVYKHPLQTYINMHNTVVQHNNMEVVHYLERVFGYIFS